MKNWESYLALLVIISCLASCKKDHPPVLVSMTLEEWNSKSPIASADVDLYSISGYANYTIYSIGTLLAQPPTSIVQTDGSGRFSFDVNTDYMLPGKTGYWIPSMFQCYMPSKDHDSIVYLYRESWAHVKFVGDSTISDIYDNFYLSFHGAWVDSNLDLQVSPGSGYYYNTNYTVYQAAYYTRIAGDVESEIHLKLADEFGNSAYDTTFYATPAAGDTIEILIRD